MGFKMNGWSGYQNSPVKETVKRRRKKHARSSREYAHHVEGTPEGSKSTHLMTWGEGEGGKFHVWPSITTDKEGYKTQTPGEAEAGGELYEFKNKRRAERFAAGSWKKGKDKREAMKAYRKKKRKERKGKIKNLKTNISKIFNPQKYK
jgi:hypothetical protein